MTSTLAFLAAIILAAIVQGVRWRVRQVRQWRREVDEACPPGGYWGEIEDRPD